MKANALLTVILISLLIVGCRTEVGVFENGRYSKSIKSAFIEDFKTLSFCKCMENATDRDLNLQEEDVSCRVPDYLYAASKTIDSLARREANSIRRTEAERTTQRAEGMVGKIITSACLSFYNSKELHGIAKQQFIVNERSLQRIE